MELLKKIDEYLLNAGKKPLKMPAGLCQGLSFLWSYFSLTDNEKSFWENMQALREWVNKPSMYNSTLGEFITAIVQFQDKNFYIIPRVNKEFKIGEIEFSLKWNFSKSELSDLFIILVNAQRNNQLNLNCKVIVISNLRHVCALTYKKEQFTFYNPAFTGPDVNDDSSILWGETKTTEETLRLVDFIYDALSIEYDVEKYICPLHIEIHTIISDKNTSVRASTIYPDVKGIYQSFFNDRINQLEDANANNIDPNREEDFKIWAYYTELTENPYIKEMFSNAKLLKYGLNYEKRDFNNEQHEQEYFKANFLHHYLTPQLQFDMRRLASPFELSIRNEQIDTLEDEIIKHQKEINNISMYYRTTPLMQAAFLNKLEAMKKLLQYGAAVDIKDHNETTALGFAVLGNNIEACRSLLEHGADPNMGNYCLAPIVIAAAFNQTEICELLLKKGGNVEAKDWNNCTALSSAIRHHNEKLCKVLLVNGSKIPLLHEMAKKEQWESIKLLLACGVDPNVQDSYGESLLNSQTLVKDKNRIQLLLDYKVDPNLSNYDKITPLRKLIKQEDWDKCQLLLKYGANPNILDLNGLSPLYCATAYDCHGIVDLLLTYKTDPNLMSIYGISPLHMACAHGHEEICKLLLKAGARIDLCFQGENTPLELAHFYNYENITQLLVDYGGKPNLSQSIVPDFHYKYNKSKDGVLKITMALYEKTTPFSLPSYSAERICTMFEEQSINLDKNSFLPMACGAGRLDVCKLLLAKGYNVNQIVYKTASTPLSIAAATGRKNICDFLLANGANINTRTYCGTPLHAAVRSERNSIVNFLLEKQANPNLTTNSGRTPLHVAVAANNNAIVKSLIMYGANIDLKDNENVTPRMLAEQYGNDELLSLLTKA